MLLEQHLWWLWSPIRERHCLPHVTLIRVCDGCALLLGCIAFRAHAAHFSSELMPSSLRGHDVFLHSSSPFGPIVSQLLPGVNVDLHTCKVPFDHVFEDHVFCLKREFMLGRPAQDSTSVSAFVTWSCQVIPSILQRLLSWNTLSLFSCRE